MDRAFDELMKQVSSSLPVKVQMNFQFFYKNREICNRTRSVATQSSDEFSNFSTEIARSATKHVCFYSLSLEIVYRKSKGLNITSSSLTIHCLITKFTEIIPEVFSTLFHSPFATPHI
jgi:hypothetical protein